MGDRTRLFITGVAAVAVLGVTLGAPRAIHFVIGDDDDERSAPLTSLKDFDGITLNGPDDVEVTRGERFAVSYEGDRDAIRHMQAYVSDGVLNIGRRKQDGWFGPGGSSVTVKVTMPALSRVWISGSGEVEVDEVKAKDFRVMLAGSGSLSVDDLDSDSVALTMRGSGDIALAGKTGKLEVDITGSGDIDLEELEAETAQIRATGSGTVDAHARRNAQLRVAGSGQVHVKGTESCEISRTGSGEAECES